MAGLVLVLLGVALMSLGAGLALAAEVEVRAGAGAQAQAKERIAQKLRGAAEVEARRSDACGMTCFEATSTSGCSEYAGRLVRACRDAYGHVTCVPC